MKLVQEYILDKWVNWKKQYNTSIILVLANRLGNIRTDTNWSKCTMGRAD
jgi:hypothetical protein